MRVRRPPPNRGAGAAASERQVSALVDRLGVQDGRDPGLEAPAGADDLQADLPGVRDLAEGVAGVPVELPVRVPDLQEAAVAGVDPLLAGRLRGLGDRAGGPVLVVVVLEPDLGDLAADAQDEDCHDDTDDDLGGSVADEATGEVHAEPTQAPQDERQDHQERQRSQRKKHVRHAPSFLRV